MTTKCAKCGSTEFVEVETYSGWFREGDFNRNRIIDVKEEKGSFIAVCREFSDSIIGVGSTPLKAILDLGTALEKEFKIKLIGNKIE